VNVYGGRIEVQTAAGKGSTFTICLPSDAATELPDRP
jgi:signal transduction histidine kinase